MSFTKEKRDSLMTEIIAAIGETQTWAAFDVGKFCKEQNITENTAYRYLQALIKCGRLQKKADGRSNLYRLPMASDSKTYELAGLNEDAVYKSFILPKISEQARVVRDNCAYAFTEMLNNAIDHSEGTQVQVSTQLTECAIWIYISDNGIGIFKKIAASMKLEEDRYAILELAKGKFTTDPQSHTGEGIFFSSKIADTFIISSGTLAYYGAHSGGNDSEYVLDRLKPWNDGTVVMFKISFRPWASSAEVFQKYTDAPEDYGFSKTIVPVSLLEYGEDNPVFVSRSQAKRLLVRFERFQNIQLDFSGVDSIGQGFADEVFRVFQNQHPGTKLLETNCSSEVSAMISRVRQNNI